MVCWWPATGCNVPEEDLNSSAGGLQTGGPALGLEPGLERGLGLSFIRRSSSGARRALRALSSWLWLWLMLAAPRPSGPVAAPGHRAAGETASERGPPSTKPRPGHGLCSVGAIFARSAIMALPEGSSIPQDFTSGNGGRIGREGQMEVVDVVALCCVVARLLSSCLPGRRGAFGRQAQRIE